MRSSSLLSPRVLLSLFWLVAVGVGASGCRRAAKPEMGLDRTVEAGVPTEFGSAQEGAPTVTWDFGDGTPSEQGAHVSHAFARAGTYTVRALDGSEEVGGVQLTVVPRPLLRAVPPEAMSLLYVARLRGAVEPLVAFYEQLVGPGRAQRQIEELPLLPMVLEGVRGSSSAVDPEEGFGLFSVPEFEGSVALLGVMDGAAALERALGDFEALGHQVERREDGSARVQLSQGTPLVLFLDRGYLYMVMPDSEKPGEGEVVEAQAAEPDLESVRRRVQGFTGPGLSESPLLMELRGKVEEGSLSVFTSFEGREGPAGFPGFFASLRVREGRADLDGFMASEKPLLHGMQGPVSLLLQAAPQGPVAAAMVSVPPSELSKWVFGAPGSPRREEALESWRQEGIDGEALLHALRGDVTLLLYFDAPAFYRNFLLNKRPEPRGALLMEAGLTQAEPVEQFITKLVEEGGWNVEKVKEEDATRFRARVMNQPLVVTVSAERLSLQAGEALEGRPTGDVGAALRERFGAGAFGANHVSMMVDLGRLRAEMEAPRQVPGVPQAQLGAAKAFGEAFMDQLTPFDHAFMDFTPEEGGARLRGRVVLRER